MPRDLHVKGNSHLPALLVLLVSMLATVFIWRDLSARHDHNLQAHFQSETARITSKISLRIESHVQILRGASGLFAASAGVERQEWRRYVEKLELDQTYRGIQGVGFAEFIRPPQLASHLRRIRSQGFPDYVVKPEGQRSAYSAIIYLEPFMGRNLRAFGFDMYSEPTRRAAMEFARDHATAALSGKVRLVQETQTDVQAGILAFQPVYANHTLPQTVEQRRSALIGWTYSPYRMDDLMESLVREDLGTIRLEIFDGAAPTPDALLFDSEPKRVASEASGALVREASAELAGRTWTLRYSALPGFAAATKFEPPWVEVSAIALIGLLLFGITWALFNTRNRAQAMASDLTASLRAVESQFRATFEQTAVGVAHLAPETGRFIRVNHRLCELFGYTRGELEQMTFREVTHPEDRHLADAQMRELAEGGIKSFRLEQRYRCKDGRTVWGNLTLSAVLGADGAASYFIPVIEDVTERKQAELALRESEQHLQAIIQSEPECIKTVDAQGLLLKMNPAGLKMIEADSEQQVLGQPVVQLIAPEYQRAFLDMHRRVLAGDSAKLEFQVIGLKGGRRWVETHAVPMQEQGQTVQLAVTRDITERKRMEDQIRQLAFHDTLTGLPNRRLLMDRLAQTMSTSKRSGRHAALLFLDLDNFKPLNDAQGHDVGDLLLVEVAQRLQRCVREIDTVARFGGDEFVLMLSELSVELSQSHLQAGAVAEKVRLSLAEPFNLNVVHPGAPGRVVTHRCTASIGVTLLLDHEKEAEEILHEADSAMYRAKEAGRNTVRFHASS